MTEIPQVFDKLKALGVRLTPQRRAIVEEIMSVEGHISPSELAERVRSRVPGVNSSTVYRTLWLLDELGVLDHAHLEDGVEYHRSGSERHVHLTCSKCGRVQSLSEDQVTPLVEALRSGAGFTPDLTHFAISGLCSDCAAEV